MIEKYKWSVERLGKIPIVWSASNKAHVYRGER